MRGAEIFLLMTWDAAKKPVWVKRCNEEITDVIFRSLPRRRSVMRSALLALPWLLAFGCGGGAQQAPNTKSEMAGEPMDADKAAQAPKKGDAAADKEETPRKIIYTANLELLVDDFDKAGDALTKLIQEQKAYVSASDVRGERGMPRSGKWTVRVPEARFNDLSAAVAKLGETIHQRTDSQDVSEGYYDTKQRLKTYQVEEEGLRKYYEAKAPTAKPEDMMAVRRELTQIRAQIEEMTGRLKRWDNQVEWATIIVDLRDRQDYVPPVVPNFGGSVGRAFQGSIEMLVSFGKGVLLFVVAASPWLLLVAVLGSPFWRRLWLAHKARKRLRTPASPAPRELLP